MAFKRLFIISAVWIAISCGATYSHAQMTVYPLPNIFKGVNMVALADVEESLLQAFSSQHAIDPYEIKLQILGFEKGVRIDLDASSYTLLVQQLDVNERTRQFASTLQFSTDSGETQKVELLGRFNEIIEIPVLVSRLPAKHIVTASDIEYTTISKQRLHRQVVRDEAFLVGKMLRRSAPAGKPLRESHLMKPLVIERNSSVTMIYQTPSMTIRTMAIALEDGAKGEVIRVRNASSSRIVQATIENASLVRVSHYSGEHSL